jgi:protein gp37
MSAPTLADVLADLSAYDLAGVRIALHGSLARLRGHQPHVETALAAACLEVGAEMERRNWIRPYCPACVATVDRSPTRLPPMALATWNPVTGCSKVSPGCARCYAERNSRRFGSTTKPWIEANAAENVVLHPERLAIPIHWKKPKLVFVCSVSDLFHPLVPESFIRDVWLTMAMSPQHTFQVLTKRPERMAEIVASIQETGVPGVHLFSDDLWPLPNVWVGTSIENIRYTWRADMLRRTPAAVHFISAEPLLGPLYDDEMFLGTPVRALEHPLWICDHGHLSNMILKSEEHGRRECLECRTRVRLVGRNLNLDDIEWLIIGGESGPGHRPMDPAWVSQLIERADIAGTAVNFKQWGGLRPGGDRLVDGVLWDQFPGGFVRDPGRPRPVVYSWEA